MDRKTQSNNTLHWQDFPLAILKKWISTPKDKKREIIYKVIFMPYIYIYIYTHTHIYTHIHTHIYNSLALQKIYLNQTKKERFYIRKIERMARE